MRHVTGFVFCLLASAIMAFGPVMQAQAVTIKGDDCVCNGESFFQASNICSELTRLAKADGILASNDKFKQIAVSGANLASIVNFYKNCNPKPTYLVSDGAGIDLMSSSNISGLSNTLKQYLEEMKKGGTKKLLWMIYPDPQTATYATLKKNQDLWAVEVPKVMATITVPKVLLVDLRPVWAGHYSQYTTDGIHCTSAGGTATAEAFWKAMKESKFFEIAVDTVDVAHTVANVASSSIFTRQVGNGNVAVSLSVDQPSNIMFNLTTVSGRSVFTAQRQAPVGLQTVEFPLGAIAPGIYCCEVQTGQLSKTSSVLLR